MSEAKNARLNVELFASHIPNMLNTAKAKPKLFNDRGRMNMSWVLFCFGEVALAGNIK